MVCNFMCRLVTFCCEKGENFDYEFFVWLGQATGEARAKVAWDTTTLPLSKRGIKVLDLEVQSTTFLTKMLVKGLALGTKPWEVLLCHRVNNLRQFYKGCWHASMGWLMIVRKVMV
jgi:hypothetical protein